MLHSQKARQWTDYKDIYVDFGDGARSWVKKLQSQRTFPLVAYGNCSVLPIRFRWEIIRHKNNFICPTFGTMSW